MQNRNVKQLIIAGLGVTLLSACATRPNYRSGYTGPVPTYYTVRRGDTVGKIARRYGLDYRYIGRLNRLDPEYTIYVNQRLKLRGKAPSNSRAYNTPANNWKARLDQSRINKPTPRPASYGSASKNWFLPSRGKIFQTYNPTAGIKGVRFSGKTGDPVLASKAGEVIYASNGLKEYGNLILIRHPGGYISAYAHNDRMLVKEGERVTAGKQVATMGSSGASRTMLEFQIRKDGKPIDPMGVLNP